MLSPLNIEGGSGLVKIEREQSPQEKMPDEEPGPIAVGAIPQSAFYFDGGEDLPRRRDQVWPLEMGQPEMRLPG